MEGGVGKGICQWHPYAIFVMHSLTAICVVQYIFLKDV